MLVMDKPSKRCAGTRRRSVLRDIDLALALLHVQIRRRNAACIAVTHSQAAATADRILILTAQGLREAG